MSTSITDDSAGSMVDFKKEDEALPPIDRGRRAWLFLFGAFMIEGLLYGMIPLSLLSNSLIVSRVSSDFWSVPRILRGGSSLRS